MSQIKGKNTKPEMLVRKFLHANGFRYRLHIKDLPGRPDIVLPKYHAIIFVHGCFWHGHSPCKEFKLPKTRTRWWSDKINRNIANDVKVTNLLANGGWHIYTIWECELKKDKFNNTMKDIILKLKNQHE